jgi:3-phosphoshikimate 1-carboxyvinyltransferase
MPLGVAFAIHEEQKAPLIIRGKIHPGSATICGRDSQPVSALPIASSFLDGKTQITAVDPGEKPWIDLTLHWFDKLGIRYSRRPHKVHCVWGRDV